MNLESPLLVAHVHDRKRNGGGLERYVARGAVAPAHVAGVLDYNRERVGRIAVVRERGRIDAELNFLLRARGDRYIGHKGYTAGRG